MIKTENKAEFVGQCIDIFEDFLTERDVILENSERDEEDDPEMRANIYGSDYDELADKFREMFENWGVLEKER